MKNSKTILMGLALTGAIFITSCKKDKIEPETDTTAPTVTVTGGDQYVDLHASYTEQGATATDNKDGNLTTNISSSGTVDPNKAGVYIISYSVYDAAGNLGLATRNVYVRHTANTIAASYAVKDTCPNMTPTIYTDVLTASSATKVLTTKFANYINGNVNFDISGNTGSTIIVPSQTVTCGVPAAPRAFSGTGNITADGKKINITYTEVNTANSTSITCTGIYTKP
ncbi:MAG: DUF5011 domain-containing protein [Bacteroidia bacterium]|nr:DUF5011 domain-containing protein [Bacteroidia bacterium]